VRVDIPDTTDPDFDWHGEHGVVLDVLEDDADELTGEEQDARLYRIDLDDHDHTLDLREWDLRPAFGE